MMPKLKNSKMVSSPSEPKLDTITWLDKLLMPPLAPDVTLIKDKKDVPNVLTIIKEPVKNLTTNTLVPNVTKE